MSLHLGFGLPQRRLSRLIQPSPYDRYNASDLLRNKPGAFDGFPLFVYNASGVTTQKLFLSKPMVDRYQSGAYFGIGIPLNLTALFKPSGGK